MTGDNCGSEDTTTGHPCQNPAESCPWHNTDNPPDTGRPTKLSYERQERIANDIETGTPLVAACRLNGISYDTYRRWMDTGEEQDEGPHRDFYERLTRALGADQQKKTEVMWETAVETGDTQLMLTVLKQRYPETWQEQDIGEAFGFTVTSEVVEIDTPLE